jgi:hypothetical protein
MKSSARIPLELIATACLLIAPAFLFAAEPAMQASLVRCSASPITKTFGKADWLVTSCGEGMLMFSPAPKNGASHPFTYRFGEPESPNVDERFRDKRARAAYLEVKSLTRKQFDALENEIRASNKD